MPALAITCNSPAAGLPGFPYTHTFPATGGTPPYSFAITSGALPAGLTLDAATGQISGTPTSSGSVFTVTVTDASVGDFAPHDLTSNTSHSPYVASASSIFSVNDAYLAFSSASVGGWWTTAFGSAAPSWLQMDMGSGNAKVLTGYAVELSASSSADAPNAWTMQGSNNGSTWTTLDTQTGQSGWSSSGETRTYSATGTTAYRYFRISISANNGGPFVTQIAELYLYGAGGVGAATASVTCSILVEPFAAWLVICEPS